MTHLPSLRTFGSGILLGSAVLLASCGYSPLYAPSSGGGQAASKVQIGKVEADQNELNLGERRSAQTIAQELKLSFPNTGMDMDTATIRIEEETSTLAVERTAITQRAQINLTGYLVLSSANGDRLLSTELATNAPYNVENSPYSTESGKTYARLTAARNLANEISRRLYLYYSTHPQGTSVVPPRGQPAVKPAR
ncbi:MAG: hypothetical protein EON60_00875 [Alphaproteobacteria bacterium]|nr:MAG: hypothetical protein EON60_00875 [Alphaproteobacteria bacterium]